MGLWEVIQKERCSYLVSHRAAGDKIYSLQFAAELEAVGEAVETYVQWTFPVNEANTEYKPAALGKKICG